MWWRPWSASPCLARTPVSLGPADVLAAVAQREMIAVADQRDIALVERLERRAVADRDHGGRRQFRFEQLVELGFRRLIERGGCLIEEQKLRRVQERTREPEPLLLARREHSVPVRFLLQLRGEPGQADRDQRIRNPIRTER